MANIALQIQRMQRLCTIFTFPKHFLTLTINLPIKHAVKRFHTDNNVKAGNGSLKTSEKRNWCTATSCLTAEQKENFFDTANAVRRCD